MAAAIGVDRSVITRLERGDASVGAAIRARGCALLGADFRLQLYAERGPLVHDSAHARLVDRLLAMRHPGWRAQVETPVPGPGRRSVDLRLTGFGSVVLFEVETKLRRIEEIIRELHGKRVAFGAEGVSVVLVLPPSHHHRELGRSVPELIREAFPVSSADLRRALGKGGPWPGDGILWLAAGRERQAAITDTMICCRRSRAAPSITPAASSSASASSR